MILLIIFSTISFSYDTNAKTASDVIVERLRKNNSIYKAKDDHITKIIGLYKNGKFSGVSYIKMTPKKSNFPQQKHMDYLGSLASGFMNPKSKYYKSSKVKKIFFDGLLEWCKIDPRDKNWWWRSIGGPKRFLPTIAAMSSVIKKDKKVNTAIGEYFVHNWNGTLNGDSNSTQVAQMALFGYALLGKDRDVLRIAKLAAKNLIEVQTKLKSNKLPEEGIQVDFGFNLHGGSGAQNYWANYGSVYLGNINWWVNIFHGTKYKFPKQKLAIISNCYLKGVQWVVYNNNLDLMVSGRFTESGRNGSRFKGPLQGFLKNNPPYKDQLEKFAKRLEKKKSSDDNFIEGTRAFWMHDQLVHRKRNYYISLNMSSKRSVANEFGNGAGKNNYYTGSGMTTILVEGNELSSDLVKKWNWRKLAGTTALQDSGKLPIVFWGQGGNNGTDFAGSVIDYNMGVSGFKYSRKGVNANKAWFFFNKGFVALGNGINSKEKDTVLTSINQVKEATADNKSISKNKIFYNKIGYFSPNKIIIEEQNGIGWLGFNHGKKPQGKNYEYLVIPSMTKNEFNKFNPNKFYKVIANNNNVQAVQFPKGIVQAVFYKKGSLNVSKNLRISVSNELILMFKMVGKNKAIIYAATPYGYNEKNNIVDITITLRNKTKKVTLTYKGGLSKGISRGARISF